jgi:hypothetical protein
MDFLSLYSIGLFVAQAAILWCLIDRKWDSKLRVTAGPNGIILALVVGQFFKS